MAVIIAERDELMAAWAARQIPHIESASDFGNYKAVGVATGFEASDRLMAVIVYHDWSERHGHCQISGAAIDPRWASRATLRAVLSVPFLQYGCNKVYTVTPHTSERVIRFNKAIGFTREATLRDHFGPKVHGIVCRMMRRDYDRRYFGEERTGHGNRQRQEAATGA